MSSDRFNCPVCQQNLLFPEDETDNDEPITLPPLKSGSKVSSSEEEEEEFSDEEEEEEEEDDSNDYPLYNKHESSKYFKMCRQCCSLFHFDCKTVGKCPSCQYHFNLNIYKKKRKYTTKKCESEEENNMKRWFLVLHRDHWMIDQMVTNYKLLGGIPLDVIEKDLDLKSLEEIIMFSKVAKYYNDLSNKIQTYQKQAEDRHQLEAKYQDRLQQFLSERESMIESISKDKAADMNQRFMDEYTKEIKHKEDYIEATQRNLDKKTLELFQKELQLDEKMLDIMAKEETLKKPNKPDEYLATLSTSVQKLEEKYIQKSATLDKTAKSMEKELATIKEQYQSQVKELEKEKNDLAKREEKLAQTLKESDKILRKVENAKAVITKLEALKLSSLFT